MRARLLQFDTLEDRRLLAGLNVFVYDDVDQSGTWQPASESPLTEHVVFVDRDGDGQLANDEPYAITDATGKATIQEQAVGQALVRLFGTAGPELAISIQDEAETLEIFLAGSSRPDNHAPQLGSLEPQSVEEDGELLIASSLVANATTDPDLNPLAFFVARGPEHGSLSWSIQGHGRYKPFADFAGSDSIVVRAFDGHGWSDEATIVITVDAVDDSPTGIQFPTGSIPENQAGFVIGPFAIEDIDGGLNSVQFSPEDIFEVRDGQLKLVDAVSLNFESTPTVEVIVTVAGGQASFSRSYTISVDNQNDPPLGFQSDIVPQVEEFQDGYEFGKVAVIDEDVGETFDYFVSDSRFAVEDGKLVLKPGQALVYADASTVALTITAASQSNGDQLSTTLVIEVVRAAPPWQNKHWALDVNDDGLLSPVDILVVINALNRFGVNRLDRLPPSGSTTFVDVNGDRMLTPLDVLILINALNQQQAAQGAGGNGPSGGSNAGGSGESPVEQEAEPVTSPVAPSTRSTVLSQPVSAFHAPALAEYDAAPLDEDGFFQPTKRATRRSRA